MKINIKRLLIDSLIAGLIISIGLMVSRTFFCGMFCGIIYLFITFLIEEYFKEKEREEK